MGQGHEAPRHLLFAATAILGHPSIFRDRHAGSLGALLSPCKQHLTSTHKHSLPAAGTMRAHCGVAGERRWLPCVDAKTQ